MNRIDIKPLSVNARSSVSGGRIVKTKSFKKYCSDLYYLLPTLPKARFQNTTLKLTARMGLSCNKADLDNTVKPFQDALQLRYGFNDSQIFKLDLEKVIVPEGEEFIEFMLEPIKGDQHG